MTLSYILYIWISNNKTYKTRSIFSTFEASLDFSHIFIWIPQRNDFNSFTISQTKANFYFSHFRLTFKKVIRFTYLITMFNIFKQNLFHMHIETSRFHMCETDNLIRETDFSSICETGIFNLWNRFCMCETDFSSGYVQFMELVISVCGIDYFSVWNW